ncbi:TPA: hypothetical protein ACFP4Y_000903 [Neisseria bacilliformis]
MKQKSLAALIAAAAFALAAPAALAAPHGDRPTKTGRTLPKTTGRMRRKNAPRVPPRANCRRNPAAITVKSPAALFGRLFCGLAAGWGAERIFPPQRAGGKRRPVCGNGQEAV